MIRKLMVVFVVMIGVGCTRTSDPKDKGKQAGPDAPKVLLAQEPSGAKGVIESKKQATDGAEVVVLGRIGGSQKPFTGRAAFTIVDASLKPCNEIEGDTCPVPWDYCCEAPDDLAKATLLVKFVDDKGKTLPHDAREWLGVKELQTVVIRGQVKKDDESGLTILASGVFVRK